jgi:hypothetical protein
LDPALRALAVLPFDSHPETHVSRLLAVLDSAPAVRSMDGFAPVISLPRVFEPEFCRHLIGLFETHGGHDIGMMDEVDGKAVRLFDHRYKRRLDYEIAEQDVIDGAADRLWRRLFPELLRAFQFKVAFIERHIVSCYDSATAGHFQAHRDNLTKATANRKFAVTINLNAEDFDGGELRFPEYGSRLYRPPTGGAVVFSCTLLHEARPVTKGKRYAYLPFLYDEEGLRMRPTTNQQYLTVQGS